MNFQIQYDQNGHFRIVGWWGDSQRESHQIVSPWTHYRGIAILRDPAVGAPEKTYMAVSAYYEGIIPHEQVMELGAPQSTTLQEVERVRDEHQQERVIPGSDFTHIG